MSTTTITTFSPAREAPQGPTLAPAGGTPTPENPPLGAPQEFSGQNTFNCSLRACHRGLSTVARSNKPLEYQAKLDLSLTRRLAQTGLFSGAHLGGQLGRNWGAIKRPEHDLGPKPAIQSGGDWR